MGWFVFADLCPAIRAGSNRHDRSRAPADEPKLQVSGPELVAVATRPAVAVTEVRPGSLPPPPPPSGRAPAPQVSRAAEVRYVASSVVPSIFGGFGATPSVPVEPTPPEPKSRTTFILLGALLGAFGAHSFYAGYHKKGGIQLAITLLTLGFGSPMSWMWAVIDICTINQDSHGIQFES
jgi:hypothetical protein